MHKSQDPVMQQKREVLARFLGVDKTALHISNGHLYGFKAFFHGNDEAYLVLSDAEATQAAETAVQEKLWLISLESLFAYFDIEASPADLLGKVKTKEIRQANEEIKKLIYHTCGMEPPGNGFLVRQPEEPACRLQSGRALPGRVLHLSPVLIVSGTSRPPPPLSF